MALLALVIVLPDVRAQVSDQELDEVIRSGDTTKCAAIAFESITNVREVGAMRASTILNHLLFRGPPDTRDDVLLNIAMIDCRHGQAEAHDLASRLLSAFANRGTTIRTAENGATYYRAFSRLARCALDNDAFQRWEKTHLVSQIILAAASKEADQQLIAAQMLGALSAGGILSIDSDTLDELVSTRFERVQQQVLLSLLYLLETNHEATVSGLIHSKEGTWEKMITGENRELWQDIRQRMRERRESGLRNSRWGREQPIGSGL